MKYIFNPLGEWFVPYGTSNDSSPNPSPENVGNGFWYYLKESNPINYVQQGNFPLPDLTESWNTTGVQLTSDGTFVVPCDGLWIATLNVSLAAGQGAEISVSPMIMVSGTPALFMSGSWTVLLPFAKGTKVQPQFSLSVNGNAPQTYTLASGIVTTFFTMTLIAPATGAVISTKPSDNSSSGNTNNPHSSSGNTNNSNSSGNSSNSSTGNNGNSGTSGNSSGTNSNSNSSSGNTNNSNSPSGNNSNNGTSGNSSGGTTNSGNNGGSTSGSSGNGGSNLSPPVPPTGAKPNLITLNTLNNGSFVIQTLDYAAPQQSIPLVTASWGSPINPEGNYIVPEDFWYSFTFAFPSSLQFVTHHHHYTIDVSFVPATYVGMQEQGNFTETTGVTGNPTFVWHGYLKKGDVVSWSLLATYGEDNSSGTNVQIDGITLIIAKIEWIK